MTSNDTKADTQSTFSEPSAPSSKIVKERILKLANDLLKLCKTNSHKTEQDLLVPNELKSIRLLKSNIYVYFYENICSTELVDKKWPCKSQEDEIHNLQSVIDSISLDVLHEDLSHLTAETILGVGLSQRPDLVSIEYLLDILKCIHEWITSKTENSLNITQSQNTHETKQETQCENVNITTTEKYHKLEQKIEETAVMAKQALDQNMGQIKVNQEEAQRKQVLVDDDNDIFRKYMKEKEIEFNLSKCKSLVTEIENIKSSSGNSSLNSSSTTSIASSVNNEILSLVKSLNLNQDKSKHVKFNIDSRTRSASPVQKQNRRRKIAHVKQSETIQTKNNELELIKNNLKQNLNLESDRIDRLLNTIYSEDFKDAQNLLLSSLNKIKNKSDLTNRLYLDAHNLDNETKFFEKKKSNLMPSASSRSKGVLLARSKSLVKYNRIKRSSSLNSLNESKEIKSRWNSATRRSLKMSKDPAKQFYSRFTIGEDGILNCLLQEFPYLYTSPETIHYLWQRHSKQIETLTKAQKELDNKYLHNKDNDTNRSEQYLKETNRKQEILMNIMRKELEHLERQQDLKRKQLVENSMKTKTREQRFQIAKVKKYYEEFRLQQKAKMLKQKTSEELIFKKLFNESLKIQKERMLDLKKYAKEQNDINVNKQLNQIISIENFYKNKFDLLNEEIKKEKESNQIREHAQHLVLNKMKNQIKSKMENDVRDLQDQMHQDKDFLYWRQLDADRVKNDIQKANYFNQNQNKK